MQRLLQLGLVASPAIIQAFHVPTISQHHYVLSSSSLFATPTAFVAGILGRFRKKREVEDQPVNHWNRRSYQRRYVERLTILEDA